MKVVISSGCGFAISRKATRFMAARGNKRAIAELDESGDREWRGSGCVKGAKEGYDRADSDLVAAVESLGKGANSNYSELKIVEVPDGVKWTIDCRGICERVHEVHRIWQ